MVLAPGETILFFGWWSFKEGLSLGGTRDIGFSLMGPTSWAGKAAQVEMTVSTVQEDCHVIVEAVIEKRSKARSPGHPHIMMKVTKAPVTAYYIKEWIQGMEEDATGKGTRKGNVAKHRSKWMSTHSQWRSWGSRHFQRQGRPRVPRDTSGGSPSSGGGSSDWGSNQSSQHSTVLRASGHQEKKINQHGQEEVWGWRSICWPSKMIRPKMWWLTICGSGL